jgi:formate dehydrogenase subunit delta
MSPDKLVYQANQIATFFRSKPRAEGVAGFADHINKFWEPRMRRQFFEMIAAGGKGFDELVIEAAPSIRQPPPAEVPPGAAEARPSSRH